MIPFGLCLIASALFSVRCDDIFECIKKEMDDEVLSQFSTTDAAGRNELLALRDDENKTPLYVAMETGRLQLAAQLTEEYASLEAVRAIQNVGNKMETCLHLAARRGYVGCVEALLSVGADPDSRDAEGKTSAHHAAAAASIVASIRAVKIIDALAKGKADLEIEDAAGCSALHVAVECGNAYTTEALTRAGAKLKHEDAFGRPVLHRAIRNKNLDVVEKLCSLGAGMEERDVEGNTIFDLVEKVGAEDIKSYLDEEVIRRRIEAASVSKDEDDDDATKVPNAEITEIDDGTRAERYEIVEMHDADVRNADGWPMRLGSIRDIIYGMNSGKEFRKN